MNSSIYQIPNEYFFRLHHVRPRFKNNVEEVLLYVATAITDIPQQSSNQFNEKLNTILIKFGKNSQATQKTIDNWRTEISALFAFIQEDEFGLKPSLMAKRLAEHQYLDEFFNYFLYSFQYPAGHIKSQSVIKQIENNIKFKPCPFILQILQEGSKLQNKDFSITAEELTFCAYFDLRVTSGNVTPQQVVQRIINNRLNKVQYFYEYEELKNNQDKFPSKGDTVRYAGDILDYMVLANLLVDKGTGFYYYLNNGNLLAINKHLESKDTFFTGYKNFYDKKNIENKDIRLIENLWFDYVNSFDGIDEFLPHLSQQQSINISELITEYYQRITSSDKVPTKIIGDYGETLVIAHEYLRTKDHSNRQHLIQKIPTPLGVGYDIQSIEIQKGKRYIEVKTTTSKKALNINRFKLTPNEWDSAETLQEHYFIYYLVVNDSKKSIFILQNPIQKQRDGLIQVDEFLTVTFTPSAGDWMELLEICQ